MGISSPLLKQAGFAKSKLAEIIQWVAQLDGTAQYWQLSGPIGVEIGGFILYRFLGFEPSSSFRRFIGGVGPFDVSTGFPANTFLFSSGTLDAEINGEPLSNGVPIPNNGVCELKLTAKEALLFSQVAAVESQRLLNVPVLSVSAYDSAGNLTHEIPLTNKAQGAFQVATTTPLGENLYTQEIIENPSDAGDQWTYLGNGRWQLDGDGFFSALQFLGAQGQPVKGYFSFEIESLSGGNLTCCSSYVPAAVYSSTGVKSFYYSDIETVGAIQFRRDRGPVKAVIKNIKHFDAEGVLIATMPNYTDAVWKKENEL